MSTSHSYTGSLVRIEKIPQHAMAAARQLFMARLHTLFAQQAAMIQDSKCRALVEVMGPIFFRNRKQAYGRIPRRKRFHAVGSGHLEFYANTTKNTRLAQDENLALEKVPSLLRLKSSAGKRRRALRLEKQLAWCTLWKLTVQTRYTRRWLRPCGNARSGVSHSPARTQEDEICAIPSALGRPWKISRHSM